MRWWRQFSRCFCQRFHSEFIDSVWKLFTNFFVSWRKIFVFFLTNFFVYATFSLPPPSLYFRTIWIVVSTFHLPATKNITNFYQLFFIKLLQLVTKSELRHTRKLCKEAFWLLALFMSSHLQQFVIRCCRCLRRTTVKCQHNVMLSQWWIFLSQQNIFIVELAKMLHTWKLNEPSLGSFFAYFSHPSTTLLLVFFLVFCSANSFVFSFHSLKREQEKI